MQVLKVVVVVMGALIAVGIGVIVYTLIERGAEQLADEPEAGAPPAAASDGAPAPHLAPSPPMAFGDVALGLPANSRVQQMVVAGDRLIVSVLVPEEGERIVVLDLSSGAALGSVALEGGP